MKILITGATGFIGSHLRRALAGRGHLLVLAGRTPPLDARENERWLPLDLAAPPPRADLAELLLGVDVVVNAAGIFRETRGGPSFDALHSRGPCALFAACVDSGVRRVVQVSALGADDQAASRFHLSKRVADEFLLTLPLRGTVVQPSLVFGPGGGSASLFTQLAALPLVPLPGGGVQLVQPVHVNDVVAALITLVEGASVGLRVPLVGPRPLTLRGYLRTLREAMGLGVGRYLAIPRSWVALTGRLGDRLESAPFDTAAWQMLERGNTASAATITSLLRRPPREASDFIAAGEAAPLRLAAQMAWLAPLLRLSIALVWIVTGVVSLGLYPTAASFDLLARAGVPAPLQGLALYGAALLDLALGVATLVLARRRWLWLGQIALIVAYTAIISARLPEFWLHPYGPVLKNLPLLAALLLLFVVEGAGRGKRDGV